MSVTVTLSTGATEQVTSGTDWNKDEFGYLTVVDDNDNDVAEYAPGWLRVAQDGAIVVPP